MEVPGPPCAFRLLTAKIREILRTFVPDWRGSASLEVMAHWTLRLTQQRAPGALFRPATKWSVGRSVVVSRLSLTVRCSLPCLLHEQYDAGLRIRIQEICMSMHRGRKRNCIQGPRR